MEAISAEYKCITILYLLGIDHTRLTFRYAGRDFRLTDVAGRLVSCHLYT